MALKAGDVAPPFEASTPDGQKVRLSDFSGRPLWLVLFRYAACPFCARRVHTLIENYDLIQEAGLDVLAVFPSPAKRILKYIARFSPPFKTLSDPDESIYALYSARTSVLGALKTAANVPKVARALSFAPNSPLAVDHSPFRIPAEFLIDSRQHIARAHYGRDIDDGIPLDEALDEARRLAVVP